MHFAVSSATSYFSAVQSFHPLKITVVTVALALNGHQFIKIFTLLDLKRHAIFVSGIYAISSRSSHFTLWIRTPDCHRIRDWEGPISDLGAVNKETFLVGAFSLPKFH